ncbi:unnamed protein product [Arabidopsis arenosa]|uniref:DUF4283 domain-containing protein n=1 Tax=Arabidopsis arenosa TaxID=38785 RepID=A0A8S2B676_ARAAE|nr:unnamed protein product [Arabidopsis arenosa]
MQQPAASPGHPGEVSAPEKGTGSQEKVIESQEVGFSGSQQETKQDLNLVEVSTGDSTDLRTVVSKEKVSTVVRAAGIPEKKSWVQVAQKHVFTKQKFVVEAVDGQERVVVPKEVFVGAKPLWEDFVIGKFLSTKAPHVGKIHMIVNKIWRLGDKTTLIDVFEVNETTVKFRIRNEGMRHRILNRGMWNIMDLPMVVSKWSPFAEEAQPAMKSIQLWVTLKDVPSSLFTDKGLEFLSSAVGRPKRLHPKTEACLLWEWGHLRDSCLAEARKIAQDQKNPTVSSVSDTELATKVSTPAPEQNVAVEIVSVPNSIEGQNGNVASPADGVEQGSDDQGWITPPKTSRSPSKRSEGPKYGEVSILSNTYSALEMVDEVGEEAKDEEEVGGEVETQTTQASQEEVQKSDQMVSSRGVNLPLRQSLPRGSKTAHKTVSVSSTQSARIIPKDQSKRTHPKHH